MFTTIVSTHFLLLPLVFFILFRHHFPIPLSPKMFELFTSKTHISSLLISCLAHFCSITLSHPLYFSYFIFFSPYLLKLATFLSPLFVTTFLLFLALLTGLVNDNFSGVLSQYDPVLEKLHPKRDDESEEEFRGLEDLEIYRVVFGSPEKSEENNPLQVSESGLPSKCEDLMCTNEVEGNSIHMKEKRLDNFLKILNQFEKMSSNVEEKKVEPLQGAEIDKVVEKQKAESIVRHESEVKGDKVNVTTTVSVKSIDGGKKYGSTVKAHSQRLGSSPPSDHNLGTYGSMRKEKEWNRTLACKLFEERRSVEGDEGMDSLWETYENDSSKPKTENDTNKKNKNKNKKKIEDEFSEDEEGEIDGQLCCLQALKLSSRKMNLGIGRPNLVRISKAFKGIGWLHHVKRHSKKVHNNGD